jgi:hypothetical protein
MKFTNTILASALILLIALILIVLQLLSIGINGETDSITHYQLARYAFKYPDFFLNHWGKPLFTILASLMSQFGYNGAIAFNLICGLLSAWLAYLISRRLEYRHAWVAIVFTIFTPVYLFIMYSSLTEILFSLVLIAAIYLFISKRFIWSAIVISLIPFARTEGVMFIILFMPVLFWIKQYKALPFLLTGFVFFSIIGYPQYHDFFWFFTKMPYSINSSSLYGSGSFWYYFEKLIYTMNYPLIILSITGLLYILLNLKKAITKHHDIKTVTLYFLIIPAVFGFVFAQSYLWWKGLGVLASDRFMACVFPLSAIIATTGFEWVMEKAKSYRFVYFITGTFIISLVAYKPFTYGELPMKTGINFAVMEKLTNWLKDSPFSNHRAIYSDPMFPFYMNVDPFDQQKCFRIYNYPDTDPATLLKPGELLIWDAQFAGFEGHLPYDSLIKNNNLKLLNVFTPDEAFTIIGGAKYKLAVFMKAPRDTTRADFKQFYFNDFEGNLPENQLKHSTTAFSNSGKKSILMTGDYIYGPTIEGKLKSLPGISNITLRASARIMNPSSTEKGNIILVMSTEDPDHKIYKYIIAKDTDIYYKPGEWFDISLSDVFERSIPADGNYKIYIWYTGKNKIYVDDMKLEWMPVGVEGEE